MILAVTDPLIVTLAGAVEPLNGADSVIVKDDSQIYVEDIGGA